MHGAKKKRRKSSYGLKLQEKQKIMYGYARAEAGNTGTNLLINSESRLDNVVLRSGLANTLGFARQLVSYSHILVDGKTVNIPSYKIKPGQVIKLKKEKMAENKIIKSSLEQNIKVPTHISFDKQKLTISYLRHPAAEELSRGIDASLVQKKKKNAIKIDASKLNPGTKGLELEIETDTFLSVLINNLEKIVHGPVADAPFEKLVFVFKDNAEQTIYDALLNNENQSFELMNVNAGGKMIVMFLEPKFAGIIKLVTQKTENPLPGPIPTPTPQTPTGKKISFTKNSAKKADLSELRKGDKEAQGVELEVQPFTLNTERHGQKTFEKVVFIDNQNQNRNEKELNIYLNDVFGFKPNEITISKAGQDQPEIPKPGQDDNNPDKNKPTPAEINEASEKLKKQSKTNNITELENAITEAKKLKDKGVVSPELEAELKKSRDKLEKLKKDQTNSSSANSQGAKSEINLLLSFRRFWI
ncbi:4994_t:CDS:2 [Entrophospora sp. SA101]|nr:4994_t:CDS:2 [Entrophospora sp. SA101]